MKQFLGISKSYYKRIIYLGIPIVLGQIGIIIMGFADNIMVGQHSTDELAAASFVNNMMNLTIVFGTGFSYGLTPIVGRLFGQKGFIDIGRILKNGLVVNFAVSLLLMLLMAGILINIHHLGQPEELYDLIRPYYILCILSLPFIMIFNGFKQFADGITDTRTSMWVLLGGNMLNIIGNYILIYGKMGFPELGLFGAGISTLTSRILMCLCFYLIFVRSVRYRRYMAGFRKQSINREDIWLLNKMSWPVGLQMGMETASFNLSAIMMGWLGSVALASHQILSTVTTIGFMIYYGIGAASTIVISNALGEKKVNEIKHSAYACFYMILTCGLVVSAMLLITRNQLGYLFTDSVQVAQMTAMLCIPTIIYQFGDGMQITFANALRGIGDVKPMVIIAFISYFIISLPMGYIMGFTLEMGALGIWLAFPLGLTTAGILLFARFRYKISRMT